MRRRSRRLPTPESQRVSSPLPILQINSPHGTPNWWQCDAGIAYLVANKRSEGWTGGNHMKIYDLSDPAKPKYIRDFGLLGAQPGATTHEGTARATGLHGPISAGPGKNRVYAAYGTGSNGVIQIPDRNKLLTAFENPPTPPHQNM